MSPKVIFKKEVNLKKGKTILEIANKNKIKIKAPCEKGKCGKCIVKLKGKNIPKPTKEEEKTLKKEQLDAGYRLACVCKIENDLEVEILLED